jgi:DNA repair protein RecO (recombination protein O)
MAGPRLSRQRLRSPALLLRRVAYGETNLLVTLFTEQTGKVSAVARGARRSARRFPALEPMHLLRVALELTPGRELGMLAEATIERPRLRLTASLPCMEAAGQGLRWLRQAAPERSAEPRLWIEVNALLDALDGDGEQAGPHAQALLGAAGLRMLWAAGWGLVLDHCVRCDRACPEHARAFVDVRAGGVVCRRCGGGGVELSARQRLGLLQALGGDEAGLGEPEAAAAAIALVDRALGVHGRDLNG